MEAAPVDGAEDVMAWPIWPASDSAAETSAMALDNAVSMNRTPGRSIWNQVVQVLPFTRRSIVRWIYPLPSRLGAREGRTCVWDVRGFAYKAIQMRLAGECAAERMLTSNRYDALELSSQMRTVTCWEALLACESNLQEISGEDSTIYDVEAWLGLAPVVRAYESSRSSV